jgi:hypothetical protein
LRAGGGVGGFEGSRCSNRDGGIEHEAHYLLGSWRRRGDPWPRLSKVAAQSSCACPQEQSQRRACHVSE